MKKYLSTLHTRSDTHKKRFALATSGGVTLAIFAIWASVNFGGISPVVAQAEKPKVEEIGPMEAIFKQIGASLGAFKSNVGDLKQGLEVVNSEAQSSTYGR